MAEIALRNQPFDLAFHPSAPILFVALLTGEAKAFSYSADKSEDEFQSDELFSVRPTKRTCRGLATSVSGDRLYTVTKDKTLHVIDASNGKILDSTVGAHEASINRIALTMPNMLATGDDEGIIKLWDPRKKGEIRTYNQHFDYISDFLWLEDKKHLVATSGDGHLSVIDVRANKTEPFAHSEDQEDELLSIISIKGGTRTVVGTQSGILSIFNNRASGWTDCVDRIPGHPHSVDALFPIPAHLIPASSSATSAQAIIATGSSDGMVRLVQLFPTKVLGVVADHGSFPVERIRMDFPASEFEGKSRWLGSIGHAERIVMTDLGDALEDSDDEDGEGESEGEHGSDGGAQATGGDSDSDMDSDEAVSKGQPMGLDQISDSDVGEEIDHRPSATKPSDWKSQSQSKLSTSSTMASKCTTKSIKDSITTTSAAPTKAAGTFSNSATSKSPLKLASKSASALDSFSFTPSLAAISQQVLARPSLNTLDDSGELVDLEDDATGSDKAPTQNVPRVRKAADDSDSNSNAADARQVREPSPLSPLTGANEGANEGGRKKKRKKGKHGARKGGARGVTNAFFADL